MAAEPKSKAVATKTRAAKGQFVKGVSGNPAGRPVGRKSELTGLKQDLEIAIRSHVDAKKVARIIDKVVNKAMNGNLQAAKLILDKVLSNASDTEDAPNTKGAIRIIVENHTYGARARVADTITVEPESIPTEVSQ
jgi:hypothetical protein